MPNLSRKFLQLACGLVFFNTHGNLTACRKPDRFVENELKGNVLSGAIIGSKHIPLKILCHKKDNANTNKPFDVILERQKDGYYNAYIRGTLKAKRQNSLFEVQPGLLGSDIWDVAQDFQKVIVFAPNSLLSPSLLFYNSTNDNNVRHSRIWSGLWDQNPREEFDLLHCIPQNHFSPQSPLVGETLTVVGAVYNDKLKFYEQLVQSLQVDVLTTEGPQNEEVILSLSNSFIKNRLPINAPVYNAREELVGYVRSFHPFGVPGVVMTNIHDYRLSAELKRLTQECSWTPRPPKSRSPSQRFIDVLCNRIGNTQISAGSKRGLNLEASCSKRQKTSAF